MLINLWWAKGLMWVLTGTKSETPYYLNNTRLRKRKFLPNGLNRLPTSSINYYRGSQLKDLATNPVSINWKSTLGLINFLGSSFKKKKYHLLLNLNMLLRMQPKGTSNINKLKYNINCFKELTKKWIFSEATFSILDEIRV